MKRHLRLVIIFIILSNKLFSQVVFESGYFINDSNQKINCLIKNIDWKYNPNKFAYKLSPDDSVQHASFQSVKEFGINGISKYIRANVKIDRSSDDINNMSTDRNPIFQEERLFLKVLVEGKASLFIYENGDLIRFFYKNNDSTIRQLVYKRYLMGDYTIVQNNLYQQQLYTDLKYPGITSKNMAYIKYNKRDLMSLFVNYDKYIDSGYINHESKKQKRDAFNLSLKTGLNFSNLALQNSSSYSSKPNFGNKINFRFGIEAEYILPYNKNKWGILIEPTYQYYNSEKREMVDYVSGGILVTKVNYQSIELPLSVRHYFFINDKSKIFINISYILDFSKNSIIEFTRSDGSVISSLDIRPRNNIGFGIGYKYKGKYSIEMRYQTSREILDDYVYWYSDYRTFSIIFGYSLF